MNFETRTVLGALVVAGASVVAVAQPLGSMEWFESAWNAAVAEIPENCYLEFIVETAVPSRGHDLETLAAMVKDKPDHPLRSHYEDLLWQKENGNRRARHRLWYESDKRWRMSIDHHHRVPISYTDFAVNNEIGWQLNPRTLDVVNPLSPPEDKDPAFAISTVATHVQRWRFPGMTPDTYFKLRPVRSELSGGTWRGLVASEDEQRLIELTGSLQDNSWVRVEGSLLIHAPEASERGRGRRFDDWSYSEFFQSYISSRTESLLADGGLDRVVVLVQLRELEDGELEPLLKIPSIKAKDLIRSDVTFVTIHDYQAGKSTSLIENTSNPIAASRSKNESAFPWWVSVSGWALVPLVFGLLIWARMRESKA